MYDHLTYDDFKARIDIQDVLKDAGYHFYRHDGLRYPSYVRLDNDGHRVKGDSSLSPPTANAASSHRSKRCTTSSLSLPSIPSSSQSINQE